MGSEKVIPIIEEAHKNGKKIAIWGMSEKIVFLLNELENKAIYCDFLIDENPKKYYSKSGRIYTSIEFDKVRNDVDIIIPTSLSVTKVIRKSIKTTDRIDIIELKNTEVHFYNLEIYCGGFQIGFSEKGGIQENSEVFHFEYNENIKLDIDKIALLLFVCIGSYYEKVFLDFSIYEETLSKIRSFSKSEVFANIIPGNRQHVFSPLNRRKTMINFSGGFDSLAASCVMDKETTELVSVDWGGGFSREERFFRKFHPSIVKTDARNKMNIGNMSASFMGIGSIIYAEYLHCNRYTFGTIMEAIPINFRPIKPALLEDVKPFNMFNLKRDYFIRGLTEIGTVMIVAKCVPELVQESLESLGKEGSEKRYRKETLLEIVCEKYSFQVPFRKTSIPEKKVPWGYTFPLDFLCLYIIKNRGIKEAEKLYSYIPQEAISFVEKRSLRFYERYNTELIGKNTFENESDKENYLLRLKECKIFPYDEDDFREFREVGDFLNIYHNIWK